MSDSSAGKLPDLAGRTAIVTGATGGLGFETARALGAAGARVVLAVRDLDRGRDAAARMKRMERMAGPVEVRLLDLADLSSVRRFAADWTGDISLLVNNAGVVYPPELTRTRDGFEAQFGVNHLGHFALTRLLREHLTGRVVSVSSRFLASGLDLDDPNWERRPYHASRAYNESKLAVLLFTIELQRRLAAAGSTVIATAAHPGWSATGALSAGRGLLPAMLRLGTPLLASSAEAGARPSLYAATADIPGGTFVGPGIMQMYGAPKPVPTPGVALDSESARRLWEVSERLTDVSAGDRK
ncbi:oxidoreductase [Actinoplanes couchii]|uniref:Short-chain dehydrogenase/reductase n=1 Tax=Actinoplanes couchii TaxID=403638 RepID=A0ABQ3X4R7_9ACTN|nr:oxidoreductase [Actinoplanes couchii]MDR6326136.1 NAD(P)-dependent dehydrogenase (short-subunit alcohol dehydrogenase family) [Actinoplanes couchii]GID53511.1 putative short-chain dehydrogenase/reductase [Actinoplanes couchii]